MKRPSGSLGMRHVALFVRDLAACERFYVELLGMQVEWRPDPDGTNIQVLYHPPVVEWERSRTS